MSCWLVVTSCEIYNIEYSFKYSRKYWIVAIQNYSPVATNFNWCSYYILQALYDLSYLTFQTSQSYFKINFLRNPKNVLTISFRNCLQSGIFTISWNIFECGKLFFVCGTKYELIDKRIFSLGKRFSVFWEKIFQFFFRELFISWRHS